MRKELLSPEAFEEAVEEEISVSSDFDLQMCALVLSLPESEPNVIRRLLDDLRFADLAALPAPGELALVLPNTSCETARAAAERLLSMAPPGSTLRAAGYEPGDTPATLLDRVRRSEPF